MTANRLRSRLARVLFTALLCAGLAVGALTQDTDPTPEPSPADIPLPPAEVEGGLPGYVSLAEFLVVFPQAIWSHFILDLPARDIADVTLFIEQDGWGRQEVRVDLADAAEVSELFTDFSYAWALPADRPLELFRDVRITWRFVLGDGTIGRIDAEIPFVDHRAEWQTEFIDGLRLSVPDNRFNLVAVRDEIAALARLLGERANAQPSVALVFYDAGIPADPCTRRSRDGALVVTRRATRQTVSLPCDPSAAARLYQAAGYDIAQLDVMNAQSVVQAVSAALVDQLYGARWANADVPAWFRHGLAVFATASDKSPLLPPARNAARNASLLRRLDRVPADPAALALWQAQSYGLVLYIAEQVGVDGLFDLALSLSPERSLAVAYRAATGDPLESLLPAWRDWIFSVQAETAYRYNPYLETTATPTETPIPATFPPTATRTPTVTPTATVTPTVTGVLSPTPRPTLTPSATFTPTVTPRPPGSLPMPPAASAPAQPAPDPAAVTLVIGAGVALVALLGGAALWLIRRRRVSG